MACQSSSPLSTVKVIAFICCITIVSSGGNKASFTVVQAFSKPARSRKSPKRNKSSSGSGFAKVAAPAAPVEQASSRGNLPRTDDSTKADAIPLSKRMAVSHLFSVCTALQNPQLYRPRWANACQKGEGKDVIATRDVERGQVLSLFPIHALGIRTLNKNTSGEIKNGESNPEFVAYDNEKDEELFKQDSITLEIALDKGDLVTSIIGDQELFSVFNPAKEEVPGWLGGTIKKSSSLSASDEESNCVTLPLPGVAPICATIATKSIKEGETIIHQGVDVEPNMIEELRNNVAKEYAKEISSLGRHIEMACEVAALSSVEAEEQSLVDLGPFHQLNRRYPGLKQIHQNPDIYAIENFLTDDECSRLITKSAPHLRPSLVKNNIDGEMEQNPARTSTNTYIPQSEVPTIIQKITDVAQCSDKQLEIMQVIHYTNGQEFKAHTDGFPGSFSACGFEQSNRLATIFCYLNDCIEGGSTYFPRLDLDIRPKKGMAVIHFPVDVNLREDERTLHQGMPAVDDKWLLATWVWTKERADPVYADSKLPYLSSDII